MKAILLFDEMPHNCLYCPCYQLAKYEYIDGCAVALRPLTPEERDNRPSWCPLKPMPERKYEERAITRRVRDLSFESGFYVETLGKKIDEYAKGFNACIDEMLGEQKNG